MNPTLLQQPVFQITLPLMVTFVAAIWLASWSQKSGMTEMGNASTTWGNVSTIYALT